MSRCRNCGAEIIWARTPKGRAPAMRGGLEVVEMTTDERLDRIVSLLEELVSESKRRPRPKLRPAQQEPVPDEVTQARAARVLRTLGMR